MKQRFVALIALASLLLMAVIVFRFTAFGASLLWSISEQGSFLAPLVIVSALLDSINPCAFSILLLTVAFLVNLGKARSGIVRIGGAYILGIFIVYILIGLGILQTLHIFNTPHFMAKVGAALLMVLGAINVMNEFFPAFPIKLRLPHVAHEKMGRLIEKGSLGAALLLGVLVGLCEFPCTGGPYLTVLGLLHDQATYAKGLGYLLVYNVIFISPLVITLLIASNRAVLAQVEKWKKSNMRRMRLIAGIVMILLGIGIFLL